MERNASIHEKPTEDNSTVVSVSIMGSSLNQTSDPTPLSEEDKSNMNDKIKNQSVELENSLVFQNEERASSLLETVRTKESITKTAWISSESSQVIDEKLILKRSCEVDTCGDVPQNFSIHRTFQKDSNENGMRGDSMGQLPYRCSNNNYDNLVTESKITFLDKLFFSDPKNWKRDRGPNGDWYCEDFRLEYMWKRIAYIAVLLVLGITCFILVFMKLCGGADWMNTATFAVIIMGAAMLLPPGLYYGRILTCILCRCKGYTLWDVPAGPFG